MKKRKNAAANADAGRAKKKPAVKEPSTLQIKHVLERLDLLESKAAELAGQPDFTHNPSALRRYVEISEQAVELAPIETSHHGMAVVNLCSGLGLLYRCSRESEVLRRAGEVATHWINTIPVGDWRQPLYFLAVSMIAYHKACASELEADEDNAIRALENTCSSVNPGAGVYCTSSTLLAELRFKRYERTRDIKDLAACLDHTAEVLDAPRARIGERRECCMLFVKAMFQRYEALGSVSDLDAAIQIIEATLKEDLDREDRAEFLSAMGTALRHRFNELADRADLDRAIDSYQRAIEEETDDTARAVSMDSYANGLTDRYLLTNNLVDLDNAIASSRAALNLLPDKSPLQPVILANLGVSSFFKYSVTQDSADLSETVALQRRGLEHTTANVVLLNRLHAMLALALLNQAVTSAEPRDQIREALDHFAKSRGVTNSLSGHQLLAGLWARQRGIPIADTEVGALLWLSEIDPTNAPELLRRALEVGEAQKSWLLATDLARRPLPQPRDVAGELLERERWLLGQLSALDNEEIAGVSWARSLRNSARRDDIQRELDSIWTEIAGASPAGAHYAQMRRSPDRLQLDTIGQSEPNTALLSLLPIRDLLDIRGWGTEGLAVLGVAPGMAEPFVIARSLLPNPVSSAARQFEAEVPGDGGLGIRLETWHRSLGGLLGNQTPVPMKQARTIVVSPPRDGQNLPWNLVLQRIGWRGEDGNPLPVITVPTLAILEHKAAPDGAEAEGQNKPLSKRMMYAEPHSPDEALKLVMRMAGTWSGPLVVGNPTADLPATETEARAVASVLGVKPLIGPEAATEKILQALCNAPIIHLAAHAWFDEADPLESRIFVADGTISARDFVSSYCEAELIVLSSCEGGAASGVIGGEVVGLGHALLRAGAKAVLASLWPVDDDATAFLMASFYRARLPGVGEASALGQAMRATSEQPLWRHPYFWSGFVLMKGEV